MVLLSVPTTVRAQPVEDILHQCLNAVVNQDVSVFDDMDAFVSIGEPGDEVVRRLYMLEGEVLELGFAIAPLNYDIVRIGADCSLSMVASDESEQKIEDFRADITAEFGEAIARPNDAERLVDEAVCLQSGLPLRIIVSSFDNTLRVSIWDSIPERSGC